MGRRTCKIHFQIEAIIMSLYIYIFILVLTAVGCLVVLSKRSKVFNLETTCPFLEAKAFICIVILYVLPLPIAVIMGTEGGNLSEDLFIFQDKIPLALIYTSIFLFVFTMCSRLKVPSFTIINHIKKNVIRARISIFTPLWLSLVVVSFTLLMMLASQVGGMSNLFLKGYKITELFVGQGHFAISFEWLSALLIIWAARGAVSGNKYRYSAGIVMLALYLLLLLVMGRRGMVVVVGLAAVYLMIQTGHIKRLSLFGPFAVIGFILLNWIGLVRGESYASASELISVLVAKTKDLAVAGDLFVNLSYTLTTGLFVVPFESLPQLMLCFNDLGDFWYGSSIFRSLLLLVPGFLMSERPLPLSNWYMQEFYGGGYALNEGRQFFFLSEAYLNFGWFGCVLWAILVAIIIRMFSQSGRLSSYQLLAIRALFFGNLLNFVASDTTSFFVAFLKGYGFIPIVFILFDHAKVKSHHA